MAPEKPDPFGVRPASLGSANSGNTVGSTPNNFVVNPENLLSAAAQMASAFAASDMDYLGTGRNQYNDFNTRFNNPAPVPPQPQPGPSTNSAFMPPTSKLNPNAPDFMRPSTSQDFMRRNQQQNLLNKNNFNASNSYNRFNNSNNLPNILTNQGINAYLQSQSASLNNSALDLSAFDTNILSGRSIKEINELIAGTATGPLGGGHHQPPPPPPPQQQPQQPPPPQPQQVPPVPSAPNFNYFNDGPPKFNSTGGMNSRPIGSERSRLEPMIKPPSNSPWDLSTLYDTIGGSASASTNNDFGGFLGSSQTLQQTLDAFNGFSSQGQGQSSGGHGSGQADYLSNLTSPVMGMTPNVTPSKSDYGDYLNTSASVSMTSMTASGLPNMINPGGSAGKKMGYLDQQPLGLAGRGDPASVRRNINQSWNKKWGDD